MPVPDHEFDVVVLGLGIHGSAAAYELAGRGLSVLGIEQFEPGHRRGSSHGATRMTRRAYPNEVWNDLVKSAHDAWARWERSAGRTFVHVTGGLFAHRHVGSMQGGRGREIGSVERVQRMPSLAVPDRYRAFYDPDAGVVEAEAALIFAQAEARLRGAELAFGERVEQWIDRGSAVTVVTDRRRLTARRLVIAGGPWAPRLVPALASEFEVWRIVTLVARPGQVVARPVSLGAFSIDLPGGLVFGLPEVGDHGAKLGVDAGRVWDPDIVPDEPTASEVEELGAHFRRLVPGVDLDGAEATACLYTMTKDRRFVIGSLGERSAVVLVAACSGHGFKFGPAIGESVADIVQGHPRPDLEFLSPRRWAGL